MPKKTAVPTETVNEKSKNTVLVIDDDSDHQLILKTILKGAQYNVKTASSGEEALEMLKTIHPNVILLDVQMPGMNGYEVCENIKSNPDCFDIPVVLITSAHDDSGDSIVKGFEVGANDYVLKSYKKAELLARVTALVRQQKLISDLEYAYKKIEEKNKELQQLNELKSDFLSIVSHELKTPLTSMKISLDILLGKKSGELNDMQERFLNIMKTDVNRLTNLINDLLDFSRLEAGRMDINLMQMNLLGPLKEVVQTMEGPLKEKKLELELKIPENLPKTFGDRDKHIQIITNLLTNAMKFTPSGGKITITVRSENKISELHKRKLQKYNKNFFDDVEELIIVNVQDNGIGIASKNHVAIFDKFRQLEGSLTRKVGGIGLGLPIVKQLVEAHFGHIWVESEEGKGSDFIVLFPIFKDLHISPYILKNLFDISKKSRIPLTIAKIFVSNKNEIENLLDEETTKSLSSQLFKKIRQAALHQNDKVEYYKSPFQLIMILQGTKAEGGEKVMARFKQILNDEPIEIINSELALRISTSLINFPKDGEEYDEIIEKLG